MQPPRPTLHFPEWVQSPTGLFLPFSLVNPPATPSIPRELLPEPVLTAVIRELPSSYDQMHAYVDEGVLDLQPSTPESQVERLRHLPFEAAAIVLSRIASHADLVREAGDRERELELAHSLYGYTKIWPKFEALVRHRGMRPFAEQHFVALMRLLVLHGAESETIANALSAHEWITLSRSVLAMGSVIDASIETNRDPEGWLAYLVQNGAYYHSEPALEALSRVWAIFGELPQTPEFADHRDRVPIDEWLLEGSGLTLIEQLSIGFAALGMAHAFDDEVQANERAVLAEGRLDAMAEEAGLPKTKVAAALTADREWYQKQFSKTDGPGAGWDRVPFEQKPFLRLSDGRTCLWHPRFILSWLTEGIYYRLLDVAGRHGELHRYTRYVGALTERYALEVMREVHAGPRRFGAGVVHGDASYGGRKGVERRTPDVAIDWGADLVLIEVGSRRLTLESRRGGDPKQIGIDVDRMIGKKLTQLGDRVSDLLDPKTGAEIAGVELGAVKRIWPILVTGAGFIENEILWDRIEKSSRRLHSLAGVQPVTLMDLSDLELLAGLVEAGYTVVELLARKTQGPYRRIDFRRFVNDDPHISADHASGISKRWHKALDLCAARLGFTDEQIARMRAA